MRISIKGNQIMTCLMNEYQYDKLPYLIQYLEDYDRFLFHFQ